MKNLFVDTNVIIDFLANRQPFSETAAQLFDLAEAGKIKLFLSSLSFSTIYYIVKKSTGHTRAITLLKDLETLMETVDITRSIIMEALESDAKDFEDSIQYHAALSNKRISVIVTRDSKGYTNSALPVLNPEEVLGLIRGE